MPIDTDMGYVVSGHDIAKLEGIADRLDRDVLDPWFARGMAEVIREIIDDAAPHDELICGPC